MRLLLGTLFALGLTASVAGAQTTYTVVVVSESGAQDNNLVRDARDACREFKVSNPALPAPYGFEDNANCTGAPPVTGLEQYLAERHLNYLRNLVQAKRDADGRVIGITYPTLSTAERQAIKGACTSCVFGGE